MNRAEWILSHVKGKDVLNVGCVGSYPGLPNLHVQIAQVAKSADGIDTDLAGVLLMRKDGFTVAVANAETFISEKKYEAIVMGECLEHMERPFDALRSAMLNLAEGGELIITTPNARWIGVFLYDVMFSDHLFLFSPNLMKRDLEALGLRVIETAFFKEQGQKNLASKLYNRVVLKFWPEIAIQFGIRAVKA